MDLVTPLVVGALLTVFTFVLHLSTKSRYDELRRYMDKRFDHVDQRFDQVDKRFEQVDKRFDQVDKRFERIEREMGQLRSDLTNALIAFSPRPRPQQTG